MLKQVNSQLFYEILKQFSEDQIIRTDVITSVMCGDEMYAIAFNETSFFVSSSFELVKIGDKSFCIYSDSESRIN